ncbi:MAG: D-glycero-beta-D-manno-heptose 1-phosphate adenylyltransferase [Cyclobacteriaceae bacterium]
METSNKIIDSNDIINRVKDWRSAGQKIVFTNGCFDILHLGHVDYLEKARTLGDILLIGVNTDASVRRIKGPERPINNEYARLRMLSALAFVDGVTLFDEDTPLHLIQTVLPDILVKGNDYNISNIVGAEIVIDAGGKVETIDLVKGFSTTDIIERVRNL